jgi:hypothetical protein
MSSNPTGQSNDFGDAPASEASGQLSDDERRAAVEAELSRITSTDLMVQATVSLMNIAGHRLGAPSSGASAEAGRSDGTADAGTGSERDLEQVRDAIDAVRALLGILERRLPNELGPLRDALSQLQIAYAREIKVKASNGAPDPSATEGSDAAERPDDAAAAHEGQGEPGGQEGSPAAGRRPGPAEASGKLWVPGR